MENRTWCHLYVVFNDKLTASVVQWSELLATNIEVLGSALPDFLRSSGPRTGSTQPREDN
jgi:hypothetical protein